MSYKDESGYTKEQQGKNGAAYVMLVDTSGNPVNPATATTEIEVKNDAGNALFTEPLGRPTLARQLTASNTSTNTQLTSGIKRVSMRARNADIRFEVGATAQTASATTSHFIAADERLDIAIPAGGHIAIIRDSSATADGILNLSELV